MRIASLCCLMLVSGACGSTDPVGVASQALALCPDGGEPAHEACLFGDVFSDIRSSPALTIESEVWIRDADGLQPIAAEQLLRAVQQSSHSDVTTAAEALTRVDEEEVRVIAFVDERGRAFSVYEYGVGDNSYGAYFERESDEVIASIHDGDILDCTVLVE